MEAGVEEAFAVFPQAPVLLEPAEGALDDPALGEHGEGVRLAALDHFHPRLRQQVGHGEGEGFAAVAPVDEDAEHPLHARPVAAEEFERAVAVRPVGRGHHHRVQEALRVHHDVPLYPAHLLARVVALLLGRVSVLDALRVGYEQAGALLAPKFEPGLSDQFFL